MRVLILLIACAMAGLSASCQTKAKYGDNPAAGHYYNIRGIKMYVEIYGEGKPLLLLHGNGGSIGNFASTIPYFSTKYKVIAIDSRAHGKTVDPGDSLSFEQMADDFAALLDTLHTGPAYVIGWSDGGIDALELAMRHPDKVIKFASTGANLTPDSTALIPSLWKDMVKEYNEKKDKPRTTAVEKNSWKIFMLDYDQPHIPVSALKAIKCPALIINGDHDLIPVEHAVQIWKGIPKAWLWIVPNSGHPTLIEHRDEFNKKVDDFFMATGTKW